MEKQLPYKVKESSEYLNLKKMEEHMARQKMYTLSYPVIPKHIKSNKDYSNSNDLKNKRG